MPESPLTYYTHPGMMTDPKEYSRLLDGLPTSLAELCLVVQGIQVHIFWAERYGLKLSEERQKEVNLRTVVQKLKRIRELDDRPLNEARSLEKRLVGNCRDFSVLLAAILQHQGVPARPRCGFGTYFMPDHYEDHWVCEVWRADGGRWGLVDAQLDALQQRALEIRFDPLDVPYDRFVTGGKAWLMCRRRQENPDKFGIFDMHGMGFIRGDLIRDFLSFNKVEILPWDAWGLIAKEDKDLTEEDMALLDRIAELTLCDTGSLDPTPAFTEMRTLFESEARLKLPGDWKP